MTCQWRGLEGLNTNRVTLVEGASIDLTDAKALAEDPATDLQVRSLQPAARVPSRSRPRDRAPIRTTRESPRVPKPTAGLAHQHGHPRQDAAERQRQHNPYEVCDKVIPHAVKIRLLRDAKRGRYDILLVYRVDRLARSVRGLAHILEELDDADVAFRSATEPFDTATPAGRMMVQMLGVFAEFERATIIDRVIAGMERKAARGEWTSGQVTYGYSVDSKTHHLVINETEAAVVALIFDLYVNQCLGSKAVANWLNSNGHRNRNGRLWNQKYVLAALRNRTHIGELFFRETWYIAPHEPIIDLALFERAQSSSPTEATNYRLRRANGSDYLLSGVVTCQCCEKHYVGTAAHGRSARYRYYTCHTRMRSGRESCGNDVLSADALEQEVVGSLIATLSQPGLLDKALKDTWAELAAQQQRHASELDSIDAEIRKVNEATERYLTAFENGTMSDAQCGERLRRLEERERDLLRRRSAIADTIDQDGFALPTEAELDELRAHLTDALAHGASPVRKATVRSLVHEVRVYGRDRIVPIFRVPQVGSLERQDEPVLAGSFQVGAEGLEPPAPSL
ncbi:MAG: site-specific recombinase [Thermoleophilaceae bacterium]|nr:site-specific recombinase [Thermoleophilaceae bacterium]